MVFCARSRLKRGQKHTTKNFVEFHNYSPLRTMYRPWRGNMYPGCFAAHNRSFATKNKASGTHGREYVESNTK